MTARLVNQAAASLLMLATLIAGCSKPNVPVEETHVTREVADSLANVAARQVADEAPLQWFRAMILAPVGAAPNAGKHSPRAARRGAVADDSTSYYYEITCYGLDGRPADWTTTPYDSIERILIDWEFYVNVDYQDVGWSWHSHWHSKGKFDLRGFSSQSAEFQCDGASRDSADVAWADAATAARESGRWLIDYRAIRWGKDFLQHPYPLSGSLGLDMEEHWRATGEQPRDVNVRVAINFNGTRYAVMVVDGIYRYHLDLDTGETTPVSA